MAPIKFEENIKEKLEERSIQPSNQAWNTLSKKLDADTKKISNKTIWWLGIAASLVGLFFMLNPFLETTKTNYNNPVIVDTENKEIKNTPNTNTIKTEETIVVVEDVAVGIENTSEEKTNTKKAEKTAVISKQLLIKKTNIVAVETKENTEETVNNIINETPLSEGPVAVLNKEEAPNKTETDIDALLKKAQQNLAVKPLTKTKTIDAHALLQDVEEDIESSFREKVFETLISGFKKVKTAVADRNE